MPTCVMPTCVMPTWVMPNCVMPNCVMPTCVILACVMPTCVMPTFVMPTCVMPTCVMPNCVMPTCVMPTCVMPTCVMPNGVILLRYDYSPNQLVAIRLWIDVSMIGMILDQLLSIECCHRYSSIILLHSNPLTTGYQKSSVTNSSFSCVCSGENALNKRNGRPSTAPSRSRTLLDGM